MDFTLLVPAPIAGTVLPPSILAFIPAHNEEDRLADAIRSMLNQTVPVSSLQVISDNSTDRTVEIAESWGTGISAVETVNNRHRKAGALNQVLTRLKAPDDTFILVMDADSSIAPTFVESALGAFTNPKVGAVGGIFVGDGLNGFLGAAQNLEYMRYAREIGRNKARARVLTGTATMTRLGTLREVAAARAAGVLPGSGIYNYAALTEDFCLTLAVKSLGYTCVSPKACRVTTETMASLPALWRQRMRWQRGALQSLRSYGISRVTLPYIARQFETGLGLLALILIWAITFWSLAIGQLTIHPIWVCVGMVFLLERLISGWRADWRGRILAASVIGDTAFDLFIGLVYVAALVQSAMGTQLTWGTPTIDATFKKETL